MWQGTTKDSIAVRLAPDGAIASGGYLPKGAKLLINEVNGVWLHITSSNGIPRVGWVNAGATMQFVSWSLIPNIPPPPPPPPPVVVLTPFTLTVEGHKPFSGNLEKL